MEYVYSALLLHAAGKEIDESAVTSILKAAGVSPDATRVKALVAALDGVNIDEAISTAVAMPTAAGAKPQPSGAAEEKKEKKEEKKEEEKKVSEEEAAAGLGALFG